MSSLLDGRKIAKKICYSLKEQIKQSGITPGLAVVLVGSNPASEVYVTLKERACKKVGIHFEKHLFFHTEQQGKIVDKILELNTRPDIHAMLVQLPLPAQFDENEVVKTIDPRKDVDGFHPDNIARMLQGENGHPRPVLVKAIVRLLEETQEQLNKKNATIVANSDVFMAPLDIMLKNYGMNVEWAKPNQPGLFTKTQNADVLIVAIGQPWSITPNMIKEGSIVIDVGITRDEHTGDLLGDVHPNANQVASWITPVPGGVGPVTVAMLLENTFILAEQSNS